MLNYKARIDTQFIDDVKMGAKERFMDTSLTIGGSRITTPISYIRLFNYHINVEAYGGIMVVNVVSRIVSNVK